MKANKEMVEDWKKYYLSLGHSYPSTRTYYSFIKRFVGDEIDINQRNVNAFREKNMSPPAAGSLKSFFSYLVRRKGFPQEIKGLYFDRSISKRRIPTIISHNEIYLIIDEFATQSLKLKLFTKLGYELALRISEILKLKWEDFNWYSWLEDQDSWGQVNIMDTKRDKFRVVPVKPSLMKELYEGHPLRTEKGIPIGNLLFDFSIMEFLNNDKKSLEENKDDYIIASGQQYRRLLYSVSKAAIGKKISPHTLRHSKAQHLYDAGMPIESIQALLGHDDISTTLIYAKASAQKVKMDMLKYDK